MSRLVQDFGCNPAARDLVRVLRVPGFWHMKNPDTPHLVSLVEVSGRKYAADEIVEAFPPIWPEHAPARHHGSVDDREFERVLVALSYIDADPRETWFRVGAALKSEFGESGRELWDGWSATSSKYDKKEQERTWCSLGNSDRRVRLGTIYHLARLAGFGGRP
jgi:hypothetical protein